MAEEVVDSLAPRAFIFPHASDVNKNTSGAFVIAAPATGAAVMSGTRLYIYNGSAWVSASNTLA